MSTLKANLSKSPAAKRLQKGMSLIELMVAMTIGLILVGGAFYVYSNTRSSFITNDLFAAMQDNARFALSTIEPDIQLAGFWGNHRMTGSISGDADELNDAGDVIVVGNDCADNWIVQSAEYLNATNNLGPTWTCFPAATDRYLTGTDVFWVRRAESTPVPTANLVPGQMYIRSSETPRSIVFEGTAEPAGLPLTAENYRLLAHAYYISSYTVGNSTSNDGLPSLRRIELGVSGGEPTIFDNEIVPGVEQMQVQLGLDLNPGADPSVDVYVNADNPLVATGEVRALRVWLLVRSESPEAGHSDDVSYQLGDQTIPATGDGFRRIVVSRTIMIRNSM